MKKVMLKGFTIIEVIIVLVIGAIIMIAVFLVVPQLQQSARNNQRRSDASQLLLAMRKLWDEGKITTTINGEFNGSVNLVPSILRNEIRQDFKDPSLKARKSDPDTKYQFSNRTATLDGNYDGNQQAGTFEIKFNSKCNSNNKLGLLNEAPNSIAVLIQLEPSKFTDPIFTGTPYCIDDAN
jgi:prepilin-type N-terminal cleavage/methylation domain-containing protein